MHVVWRVGTFAAKRRDMVNLKARTGAAGFPGSWAWIVMAKGSNSRCRTLWAPLETAF